MPVAADFGDQAGVTPVWSGRGVIPNTANCLSRPVRYIINTGTTFALRPP